MPKLVASVSDTALETAIGEGWGLDAALDAVRPDGSGRMISRQAAGDLTHEQVTARFEDLRRRVAATREIT